MIQLRRADGRDWDGFIHVNPQLKEKGFMILYNPTSEKITRTIKLPLYYTGLTSTASIKERDGSLKRYLLNRSYEVTFTFTIPANTYNWYIVE
jgi:tRNA A58 N-methylase Trm61